MFIKKLPDVYPTLPTTDDPSARKQVVLGTAEHKVDKASHSGAANRFVIVLVDQSFLPSIEKWSLPRTDGMEPIQFA